MKLFVYEDPEQCRRAWETLWPKKGLFDLWQVRSCFHDAFARPLHFHVVEKDTTPVGLLALCWDGEKQRYVQFPGETWKGKTWLEQNKIIAKSPEVLDALLDSVSGPLHLRYLSWNPILGLSNSLVSDEMGYYFYPGVYGNSFENLASFLTRMGMMRITTVLIDGVIAAVDMGALDKNSYTLLAGGTSPEFPGVAKLINLHHLEWACSQKIEMVDFLCGDYNWNERFHLTPRPLYELTLNNSFVYNETVYESKGHRICA
ncbi:MAG: GNAT family N-acetyltransferase [Desulfobacterium sp.]|nr:GNAT family N-acetyltransferase [Desulfobacterium sp.]